ncbi:hypothetical protein AYM40_19220 [Paraburkholderia phytofirmans OLGA172]|uniref:Cytochrome c domain-containing protein n=2 Tax=Paraburkholderia phytofirmans TaxID=261302 RepID=A0A160FPG6_9BURK|nr:hypothetical protein AYM40_19220 [Paraburkholderia phytofirmans OLGA172]
MAPVFTDPDKAFAQAMYAIERFELEDPSFHPYTSKFDDCFDVKLQLTAHWLRGKKLFDNPADGNCASCHIDRSGVGGSHPLFRRLQLPGPRRAAHSSPR